MAAVTSLHAPREPKARRSLAQALPNAMTDMDRQRMLAAEALGRWCLSASTTTSHTPDSNRAARFGRDRWCVLIGVESSPVACCPSDSKWTGLLPLLLDEPVSRLVR